MNKPHWLETCRGPVIKVEHVNVSRPGGGYTDIGWWTRRICQCEKCSKIYLASPAPGKWTLEDLNGRNNRSTTTTD